MNLNQIQINNSNIYIRISLHLIIEFFKTDQFVVIKFFIKTNESKSLKSLIA